MMMKMKMKMKTKNILLIITLLTGVKSFCQDPHFTQFYSNPLYQAPSFAGAISGYRVAANYRDQWIKMPGLLRTINISADMNIDKLNSGLGLIALSDVAGSANYSNTYVGLLYSYNIRFTRRCYLRPGLGFYYSQRTLDHEKLVFASQIYAGDSDVQPVLPEDFHNVHNFDGSVSLLLSLRNSWVGVCADHLLMPNVSLTSYDYKYPVKLTIFGGTRLYKLERLISTKRQTVTIAGSYRHQGQTDQVDVGLYWSYTKIVLGIWYRDLPLIKDYTRRDAISVLLGFNYKDLNIGYSYDFTISRLATSTGGAHELSLSYKFEIERKHRFKPVPCPEF